MWLPLTEIPAMPSHPFCPYLALQTSIWPVTDAHLRALDSGGTAVGYDGHGRPNRFARPTGMSANGELEFDLTFVTWAPDAPANRGDH